MDHESLLCKKKLKQQHIVKIFYMGILYRALIKRNTKLFVWHWHSPKSPSTEWSWLFFIIEFIIFICYAVGLLKYSESMIKGRNSHCLHINKLYFNASKLYQKCEKLQNVPSLHHKHHVALFIFTIIYLKQKIWILLKKWCYIMKNRKLYNPSLVVHRYRMFHPITKTDLNYMY